MSRDAHQRAARRKAQAAAKAVDTRAIVQAVALSVLGTCALVIAIVAHL